MSLCQQLNAYNDISHYLNPIIYNDDTQYLLLSLSSFIIICSPYLSHYPPQPKTLDTTHTHTHISTTTHAAHIFIYTIVFFSTKRSRNGTMQRIGNYRLTDTLLGKGHFARVEEAVHTMLGVKVSAFERHSVGTVNSTLQDVAHLSASPASGACN